MTVKEVIEKVSIPNHMLADTVEYPHVYTFYLFLKGGHADMAYEYYRFFSERGEFFGNKRQVKHYKNKRKNEINRKKYGNNWKTRVKKEYKQNLYKKQEGKCNICLTYFSITHLEIDHIKRVSQGGEVHNLDNMQLLCTACHDEKDREHTEAAGAAHGADGAPWVLLSNKNKT